MSFTPFHDMADQLETIAAELRTQGDAVHLGTFTVPAEPPQEPGTEEPGPEPEPPDPDVDPEPPDPDGSPGPGDGDNEQITPSSSSTYAPPPKR